MGIRPDANAPVLLSHVPPVTQQIWFFRASGENMSGGSLLTRADWLQRGLAISAGVASGTILADGFASVATSASLPRRDVDVLNFALAFEELQANFYAQAVRTRKLSAEWLRFAEVVGEHERAHVTFLRRELAAAANPAPAFQLTPAALEATRFPEIAVALEDVGVALYNGQAANVSSTTLAAVSEIVSVEARHAGWARDLAGETPAPYAADPSASPAQAEALLARLGIRKQS